MVPADIARVKTIDAHVAGAPLRLIVDGFPALVGSTLAEKQEWAEGHAEPIWLALVREPRGHADMLAAVLTEPASKDAVAGVLFFGPGRTPALSGQGLIGAVTIALEYGLLGLPSTRETFVVDTVAGPVHVRPVRQPRVSGTRVIEVAYRPPPVAVAHAGLPVTIDGRRVRVDIVWASGWYVVVDREALAIPAQLGALEPLRHGARRLLESLESASQRWNAPVPGRFGLEAAVLTGPPGRSDSDLRSVTVHRDGTIDRSPSGGGTSAVLAVLDAMGLIPLDRPFRHEGPSGQIFQARVVNRLQVGELETVVPEVTGQACITGEHVFLLDPGDPLATGFSL